ncbi:unnamed protein product [Parascedosporium putredinis]|uniref:Uncharacterized protein n=1 Tax=Parascedosporium putredinis TaxID=1442378 RepID=A0A9P1M7X5_9PEZI|nr:unnamed protein product [Parascedosporium putredinis]CAI7989059.1 unnamed protein product [Parascedosporium putredinis]
MTWNPRFSHFLDLANFGCREQRIPDPAGFSVALRLLGHAQAGRDPTPELARQSGPLPQFDGVSLPNPTPPAAPAGIQPQGTGVGPVRIPPLTPDKAAQYAGVFERQPLLAGNLLPGDQAKQIFEKSGLPNEALGAVWQLVDTEQRGALIVSEFVIAMHLLNSMKAASRRGPAPDNPRSRPAHYPPSPGSSAVPPRCAQGAPSAALLLHLREPAWDGPSPPEKAKFDTVYEDLDKTKRGFITGEEAVPFFSQSNLNPTTLAQIWDLADINSQGVLTRDEFAVAMYLIRQQRASRDGSAVRPPTAGSPFDAPIPQQPPAPVAQKSALDDLFELDNPRSPTMMAPLPTGGSTASDPFSTGHVSATPGSPGPYAATSAHRGSKASASAADDLLGDADPEISSKLTNETTELANISNQIGTLTKQMTNLQTQRTTTQRDLTQTSQQKKTFEQRLTQLRTLYEKEATDVRSLEQQLTTAKSDSRKLQAECMSLEGTYHDLSSQKQQVVAALQADQQENASLKEKIRSLNAEIAQLKPQIEKLKSEARQQKGLVAINKKQLSTNEAERDRLKSEADDLSKGARNSRGR